MNNRSQVETVQLRSADGEAVTLKSVHVEGRLEGLLLAMKTRQHYRNTGQTNIETVYTFPLPWGATLLGLHVEIDGHRLIGTVLEKKQATAQYEKAIDDGDTPILVEQSAQGLYTANLGNLKPDEEAIIEIEYAQLLRFEQGQVRITIPATVAPRYGDAHRAGGLAAHESVASSPLVEYPLTLQITLAGAAARCAVQSPSHAVAVTAVEDGLAVSLKQGGLLDRDFVLLLEDLQGMSFATVAPDGDAFAVLASFCPDMAQVSREPLRLKILVDCSGSMGGDSIQAARSALHEVLKELEPADCVSYSRFGSDVDHVMGAMRACNAATIAMMANLVSQTDADLGGTEMNHALLSTFGLGEDRGGRKSPGVTEGPLRQTDVLLITDGEIWGIEDVVQSARTSGHRVFAIGVGSSPAESLLRELADSTGGACELASPKQDLEAVIVRMFRRLRAPRSEGVKVDWGQDVAWQSELPGSLFGGDTVHIFSRLPQRPQRPPVLSWSVGAIDTQTSATQVDAVSGDRLARMAGAAQLAGIASRQLSDDQPESSEQALTLALHYQLVTSQTSLFLVHVRAEGEKATGLPGLEQIAQMQAAGWGGAGSVMPDEHAALMFRRRQSAGTQFSSLASASHISFSMKEVRSINENVASINPYFAGGGAEGDQFFDVPTFLRKSDEPVARVGDSSPLSLLEIIDATAQLPDADQSWVERLDALGVPRELVRLVDEMADSLGTREQAWGVVLHWLAIALAGDFALSRLGARIVRYSIRAVDPGTLAQSLQALTQALGPVQANAWISVSAGA